MSVSLNNVGSVERELDRWEPAGEAYRESLQLRRRLAKETGETPQALRDVSVSLNNVGSVERELGRWEAAGEAYRESLQLRRRLANEIGETPQALEDVAISQWNLAQVAMGQRDREAERSHLSEALANMKRASAASPTALRLRNNVQQLEARLRDLNSIDSE